MGAGRLKNTSPAHTNGVSAAAFSIDKVPESKFYQIRLGRRTSEQYATADLEAVGWNVDFTIQRR